MRKGAGEAAKRGSPAGRAHPLGRSAGIVAAAVVGERGGDRLADQADLGQLGGDAGTAEVLGDDRDRALGAQEAHGADLGLRRQGGGQGQLLLAGERPGEGEVEAHGHAGDGGRGGSGASPGVWAGRPGRHSPAIAAAPAVIHAARVDQDPFLFVRHLRPDGDIDTYRLRPGRRYVLGRGSQAHVRVLDPKLSRAHAAFERRAGVWQVSDLGSTNGIRCDDAPVDGWRELRAGTRIAAGETLLVVDRIAVQGAEQAVQADLRAASGVRPAGR